MACGTGALSCASATNATTCNTAAGYYLSGLVCVAPATGTLTIGNPVSTVAITGLVAPNYNYYISGSVALICPTGAATCSST